MKPVMKRDSESIEGFLGRYRRVSDTEYILGEYKKHQFYEKPSSKRHVIKKDWIRKNKYKKLIAKRVEKFGEDSAKRRTRDGAKEGKW